VTRRKRCQAAVYKRDCYRVDRRANVPGKFSMHYTRKQCKRPAVSGFKAHYSKDNLCWQHEKIATTPGAAYPEVAGYRDYMSDD